MADLQQELLTLRTDLTHMYAVRAWERGRNHLKRRPPRVP